ncbi:MAG: DNA topoisomerase 3 [Nannocystaceae bacterium]
MTITVLAEKPSVARDIAAVLGATGRHSGYLEGGGYVVTWALGHLVELSEPHEMCAEWKRWQTGSLPMLPKTWPLRINEKTRTQFEIVRKLLNRRTVTKVICATDAGREGELIFRYIMEVARCRKPVERLWISSLTPDSISRGFRQLRRAADFDGLAAAARGRSRADWLVGMNASRAYTLALGDTLSVGRVQTPTLAMLARRELEIRDFVPTRYMEVLTRFEIGSEQYVGVYFEKQSNAKQTNEDQSKAGPLSRVESQGRDTGAGRDLDQRLPADGKRAREIAKRAALGTAEVARRETQERRIPAPRLHDLTDLQRQANRLFGMSAQQTLDVAQALYERHKLLSYPRTESRHLDPDMAAQLPAIVAAIEQPYAGLLAPGTGQRPLGHRFVDASKVSDHHAIVPTTKAPILGSLSREETRIYDLVCRRLLAAWHLDHRYGATVLVTEIHHRPSRASGVPLVDAYRSRGTQVIELGWRVMETRTHAVAAPSSRVSSPRAAPSLPSGLQSGIAVSVVGSQAVDRETQPPRHYDDGTLLSAMEHAGRRIEDRELERAMAGSGLGTPATRASIIETLLRRGYVERKGKSMLATEKGIKLIGAVHSEVKSPEMTAKWECKLAALEKGQGSLDGFMFSIEAYVRELVRLATRSLQHSVAPNPPRATGHKPPSVPPPRPESSTSPTPLLDLPMAVHNDTGGTSLPAILRKRFGFPKFRDHQREVCEAVAGGEDVLVVMPTGAGKSLCYQLPGLARGGTTLVISPLIALIEDQVAALRNREFAAERIHSGMARGHSRAVCRAYLDGGLDFLFIAPERLGVPGFPEFLARRPLALVAIDEAHCISQWGHDFRPDYRMLKSRLAGLRPTPIAALTATATARVQHDILRQLGIGSASTFIRGFRRRNIAIEIVELAVSDREAVVVKLLAKKGARPAIVYAPSRKQAESVALALARGLTAQAYHAGLSADARARVQEQFTAGTIDVVVATIAFGMGIDKSNVRTVVHTALPSSVESYYQEIGRAGRDGRDARAILFHGYSDRKTHEYFFERDYPHVGVLEHLYRRLGTHPIERGAMAGVMGLAEEDLERQLDKLWVHGGAVIDAQNRVTRGPDTWRDRYLEQRGHRSAQLEKIEDYVQGHGCRMCALIRHFGDHGDARSRCGLCDVCDPCSSTVMQRRAPTPEEASAMARIVDTLRKTNLLGSARVHRDAFGGGLERSRFEDLLRTLVRHDIVQETPSSFEKDGETITYRSLSLVDPTTAEEELRGVEVSAPRGLLRSATKRPATKRPATKRPSTRRPKARGKGGRRPR